jgi:hypothetical protein
VIDQHAGVQRRQQRECREQRGADQAQPTR